MILRLPYTIFSRQALLNSLIFICVSGSSDYLGWMFSHLMLRQWSECWSLSSMSLRPLFSVIFFGQPRLPAQS
ncbi:hypothetical protein B0H14DRAFT_2915360 [Mycena olivaceomarginata]|nr:hypothetical protein B0H14DRAFT_2915360 [Mycena olivaceomarginata]